MDDLRFERFQRLMSLQTDIMIHGCSPSRRKRIYNLLKKYLPTIDVEPSDENIQACWYEG